MSRLKLQKLQEYLQDVDGFSDPKLELEQYETTPHLAACMLHTINGSFGDIEGRLVADLGCGSGRLLIGAAMLGARMCVGMDIDSDALQLCRENVESFDLSDQVDLIQLDVQTAVTSVDSRWNNLFDCVVMNPPFGTKSNRGIDMQFVRQALLLSNSSVYSLHKTSTREHVVKVASDWGATVQVLAALKFDLPSSYSFHKHESKDIEVDLVRFTKNANMNLCSELSVKLNQLTVSDDKHKKPTSNKKPKSKSKR